MMETALAPAPEPVGDVPAAAIRVRVWAWECPRRFWLLEQLYVRQAGQAHLAAILDGAERGFVVRTQQLPSQFGIAVQSGVQDVAVFLIQVALGVAGRRTGPAPVELDEV